MSKNKKQTVSSFFNLNKNQSELEFLDVRLDTDVRLYIDPTSFSLLNNNWGIECTDLIRDYFQKVIDYIKQGNKNKALELLSGLSEPNETHLGNSEGSSSDKGVGDNRADALYNSLVTSKAISSGLIMDLEETAFLVDDIGPDMISDIVTNVIREKLIEYTQKMCKKYGILTYLVNSGNILNLNSGCWSTKKVLLPGAKSSNGRYEKLLLIPKDIVRRTPSYEAVKFNNDIIIPIIIDRDFRLGLGKVVNGTLKPYSKTTIKNRQKGQSIKSINRDFLMQNSGVLVEYRKNKKPLSRMSDTELSKIIDDKQ